MALLNFMLAAKPETNSETNGLNLRSRRLALRLYLVCTTSSTSPRRAVEGREQHLYQSSIEAAMPVMVDTNSKDDRKPNTATLRSDGNTTPYATTRVASGNTTRTL